MDIHDGGGRLRSRRSGRIRGRRFSTASLNHVLVRDKRNITKECELLTASRLVRLDHGVLSANRVCTVQTLVQRDAHVIGNRNRHGVEVLDNVGIEFI